MEKTEMRAMKRVVERMQSESAGAPERSVAADGGDETDPHS